MNYKTKNEDCQLLRQKYIEISKEKVLATEQYLNTKSLFNKLTGELYEIKYDFFKKERDTYLYHNFNSIYLQNQRSEAGDVAVFLTATLKSKYHKYRVKDHKKGRNKGDSIEQELNPNYDRSLSINDGYQVLNDYFRDLYKNLRVDRKHVKIHYQKVIEPHKNHTPHLHALIYINPKYLKNFYRHLNKMKKKHDIGRTELERIGDPKKASSYILKYMKKTFSGENEESSHYIHGWRTENKIRNYTSSQVLLPRYIFDRLNRNLSHEFQEYNEKENTYKIAERFIGKNLIELINNISDIKVTTIDPEGKNISEPKRLGKIGSKYRVEIIKTRHIDTKVEKLTRDLIVAGEDLFAPETIETEEYMNYYDAFVYRLIEFKIFERRTDPLDGSELPDKLIYDKNQFDLIASPDMITRRESAQCLEYSIA